jgi:hypothetical protein
LTEFFVASLSFFFGGGGFGFSEAILCCNLFIA